MNMVDRRKDILRHKVKKTPYRKISDIKGIVIHHSLTEEGSADAFARYHVLTNGWSNMGYTYVINRNGLIEWCADWDVMTPHVGNSNRNYLGICMVGDFREQIPTEEQYKSLYELVDYLLKELKLQPIDVLGHQEIFGYSWKQCPALDMDALRGNVQVKNYMAVANNFNNDAKIKIDMPQVTKVMNEELSIPLWDDTEMKKGQIGKLTILKSINLWSDNTEGKLEMVRVLQPNEVYRVYGYRDDYGGQYNLGGGMWVTKIEGFIKYETPSKKVLEQAKIYYK
jgi:N-acetyl-anhydromuramyl-L-alanine amidase AmpD